MIRDVNPGSHADPRSKVKKELDMWKKNQGCGSGSGSVLDPYSIGSMGPDPEYGSGSGSRRAK
jgi:hypothetical protein